MVISACISQLPVYFVRVKRNFWIAAFVGSIGFGMAQEAIIYNRFAELRQPVTLPANTWTWKPSVNLYRSLVPGSLQLLGVVEQSRSINVLESTNTYYEPGSVQVQSSQPSRYSDRLTAVYQAYEGKEIEFLSEADNQWHKITIVDGKMGLFLYEGQYTIFLPARMLRFPDGSGFELLKSQDQQGAQEERRRPQVTFNYQGSGQKILSYLTRGITWKLRYTLENNELIGWANVQNSLGEAQTLNNVDLVAGGVEEVENGSGQVVRPTALSLPRIPGLQSNSASFVSETAGTYRYRLPGKVVLQPGQTELPFARVRVQSTYSWRYEGQFSPKTELAFQRGFQFKAVIPLAGGSVNMRQGGIFVGQSSFADTPPNRPVILSLGRDPDGRATRRSETLGPNKFRITTSVENDKTYPVAVDIAELFDNGTRLEISGAERTANSYRLRFTLNPNQTRSYAFIVSFPPAESKPAVIIIPNRPAIPSR